MLLLLKNNLTETWNTISIFFQEMPHTFLAIIFALVVEKVAEELEESGFKFPYLNPEGFFKNFINYLATLILAFLIVFFIFLLLFLIIFILFKIFIF